MRRIRAPQKKAQHGAKVPLRGSASGRAEAGVAQASSPASSGGVSPPVPTRGETPRELAGGTPAVPLRNRTLQADRPCGGTRANAVRIDSERGSNAASRKSFVRRSRRQTGTGVARAAVHANGFIQRSPGKRAKSTSFEASSQSCSMARAARCASVTRLPVALAARHCSANCRSCPAVG